MIVSTGEKRRKLEGKEYKSPPPIPCTPKELGVLLDKWIANGVSNTIMFLESLQKRNEGTHIFVTCIIMCSTLLQNVGHSVD